jgi:hypothetical protein
MEVIGQLHAPADSFLGKIIRYPLDSGLGEPQRRSGRYGEDKNLVPTGNRTPAVQPVARRYTDWAIQVPTLGINHTFLVQKFANPWSMVSDTNKKVILLFYVKSALL